MNIHEACRAALGTGRAIRRKIPLHDNILFLPTNTWLHVVMCRTDIPKGRPGWVPALDDLLADDWEVIGSDQADSQDV